MLEALERAVGVAFAWEPQDTMRNTWHEQARAELAAVRELVKQAQAVCNDCTHLGLESAISDLAALSAPATGKGR